MRTAFSIAVALSLAIASAASAQVIANRPNKQGFNYNLAPCPQPPATNSLPYVGFDTFADGTPLPSCGGRDQAGLFKMVWLGNGWARLNPTPSPGTVPPCPPANRLFAFTQTDRLPNGQPMPSCGGMDGTVRFKMVWTGSVWNKYAPSMVNVAANGTQTPVPLTTPCTTLGPGKTMMWVGRITVIARTNEAYVLMGIGHDRDGPDKQDRSFKFALPPTMDSALTAGVKVGVQDTYAVRNAGGPDGCALAIGRVGDIDFTTIR